MANVNPIDLSIMTVVSVQHVVQARGCAQEVGISQ